MSLTTDEALRMIAACLAKANESRAAIRTAVVDGGDNLPINREGAIIGAIACSGASAEFDSACAEAGIAAIG